MPRAPATPGIVWHVAQPYRWSDDNSVTAIDTDTLHVVGTVAAGLDREVSPSMALDDPGVLWVTVGRANEAVAIDTGRCAIVARVPAGTLPWGVTVAPRR